jgi:hypothetical protein
MFSRIITNVYSYKRIKLLFVQNLFLISISTLTELINVFINKKLMKYLQAMYFEYCIMNCVYFHITERLE